MTSEPHLATKLLNIYDRLLAAYGPQGWWPGGSPFEVIVGAILTQSAAWPNVEKALANLKAAAALTPQGLMRVPEGELARLVHPAGYYNAKARKLKAFTSMVFRRFDGDLDALLSLPLPKLRRLLLDTYGIGPETADSIILYAAGRPVFVVDAYTRRVFSRLGVAPQSDSYSSWQSLFTDRLSPDTALFNQYHALVVRHAKSTCRKLPLCSACPLLAICPTGQKP